MNSAEKRRCVEALRAAKRALEERGSDLESTSRMARLRWTRREQSLLDKVATLQNEAQLAALKQQRRLERYLVHLRGIAEELAGYCKSDSSTAADMQSHASDHSGPGKLQKTAEELQLVAAVFASSMLLATADLHALALGN
ncbi:E3 ubiquitin-protein ligase PDZRN3-B-like [Fundulus heteroclitus]|uniref:E3 ubiquitin-protein ligase PDZRN3-B-like n=1 Tax=Fundulus heteroclitus TaxID=8078 RepID=UPI00165B9D08|nr:E3 ubiquitin-protein ligase PDZRN3-B-like [Fundulus heteroclitus]